jgi:flagellar basal body-associated protein FliL
VTDKEPEMSTTETPSADVDESPSDSSEVETDKAKEAPADNARRARAVVSVRSLLIGVVIALLAVAVGVLTWRYMSAEQQLAAQAQQVENFKHAEDAALDYAVNAAQMNYQDLGGWKTKLVAGTSPELKDRLSKAADSMEQILVPLKWDSTAKPLAARVRSESGGSYVIDAFVSVLTKTEQAPEGLQSTATYSITIDGNQNWQITDVGGVEAAVGSG